MPSFIGIDISGYRVSEYVDLADPSNIPFGTLACDGSAISRTLYAKLFAKVGTTYGVGDGSTTFNIPDRRGRGLVGAGAGPGLSARAVSDVLGEETHQLSLAETPSHNHGGGNHAHWAGERPITDGGAVDVQNGTSSIVFKRAGGSAASGTIISTQGSDGSHNNMQPSLVAQQAIAYI